MINDQNADAKGNHVRQQRRNSRDQRADSRGNSHRGRENVIGQQCGRGEQSRRSPKIESRHGVGAAARWISRDGLAIGEIHNYQQRDNRGADRNDVANAKQPKRNQQAESRFRSIGGRTQSVETEDRDALHRADLFRSFVAGFDRFADNQVKDIHRRSE